LENTDACPPSFSGQLRCLGSTGLFALFWTLLSLYFSTRRLQVASGLWLLTAVVVAVGCVCVGGLAVWVTTNHLPDPLLANKVRSLHCAFPLSFPSPHLPTKDGVLPSLSPFAVCRKQTDNSPREAERSSKVKHGCDQNDKGRQGEQEERRRRPAAVGSSNRATHATRNGSLQGYVRLAGD